MDAETDGPSTATLAAAILKVAGAQPCSGTGSGTIAGKPADTFDSVLVSNNVPLTCKMWIAKIDPSHYAAQVTLKQPNITADQTASLEQLIAVVQFTGL
jgi:hypothetical protein